ncbi:MAG: NUDIX hydrolase [Candidatus Promineifilaceae bacterium]
MSERKEARRGSRAERPRPAPSGVIEAAGGLLWRETGAGRQLALIHRARYDDWSLPKGWREPGESWPSAALREVVEETNCAIQLEDFAGCTWYTVGDRPKVVLFWHMRLLAEGSLDNDEVDALAWLSPAVALSRLSYPGERALLRQAAKPDLEAEKLV